MIAEMWQRYRLAKRTARCQRTMTQLCRQAAVREAEQTVATAWIKRLHSADTSNPSERALVELEREAHARASNKRSAATARERRRLADLSARISEWNQES
ncbi:hypothetical protein ABH926_004413 [Catenulispora sp. GP43]|uniref:hypothetical protein n=1 Tax=Catenulispora sp. GP43 TaxID=3156263 RepID=UPI0035116817